MNATDIYKLAKQAGFPPIVAVTMTAIALRESAGDPLAFNGNANTGDRSYGLWQINMMGNLGENIKKLASITDEKMLLDPNINARVAFLLYANRLDNLNVLWYINRPGIYQDRYLQHLPDAQNAALMVEIGQPPKPITLAKSVGPK